MKKVISKVEIKTIKDTLAMLYGKTGFLVTFTWENKFRAKGAELDLVQCGPNVDEWSLFSGDDLIVAQKPLDTIIAEACSILYSDYVNVLVAS